MHKNFDKFKFKTDLVKINWAGFCLNSNRNDVFAHFLKIVNKLLHMHAPYKLSNIQNLNIKINHGSLLD